MELSTSIIIGIGLAAACGFRIFVPLLVLSAVAGGLGLLVISAKATPLNVLLVVNPTGDLAGAEVEGERVQQLFAAVPGCVVTRTGILLWPRLIPKSLS